MSVLKLADEHPLTKTGLRCVRIVENAELGLRLGDVLFEFPYGRIVDTGKWRALAPVIAIRRR
jgi:hypothetical protein